MARIAGVDLPRDKRVEIALTYIYGIGRSTSNEILDGGEREPGHPRARPHRRRVAGSVRVIEQDYQVEGELRNEISMNIKRLMEIGCYRGLRHRRGLPVRGQRTHTNARTRRAGRTIAARRYGAGQEVAPAAATSEDERTMSKDSGSEEQPEEEGEEERPEGVAHIKSTFNNTIITITDQRAAWSRGPVPARSGSRARGRARRSPRRSPRENAARKAHGVRHAAAWTCYVKGPGSGRESAIRALQAAGLRSLDQGRDADPAQRLPAAASGGGSRAALRPNGRAQRIRGGRTNFDGTLSGPICRLCRREGMKLFLKGERCFTEKCAIERRAIRRASTASAAAEGPEYGKQLREKQKVKRIYGVLERQFRNYFLRPRVAGHHGRDPDPVARAAPGQRGLSARLRSGRRRCPAAARELEEVLTGDPMRAAALAK